MLAPRFIPFVLKQVARHRTRTALTIAGVAVAMFLFTVVQALQRGVTEATRASGRETTLVVYRENRFCPFTSRLPEYYRDRIQRVPGVRSVVPMRIVVNVCRASLDVVTYRGVPTEAFAEMASRFDYIAGSYQDWLRRSDSALVGETLAKRRAVKVGDTLDAAGITVYVAGIIRSDEAQDQNVGYVHLPFLQRSVDKQGDGVVTQFNVKVDDPSRMESVARAIDDQFRTDAEPTYTQPETAFVARVAGDAVALVRFTRYIGWACLAAVLALVGNAIVLSVQDRIKEHAVLQTLGYRSGLIARLIVTEGLVLSLLGGVVGALLAWLAIRWGRFSISVDGVSLGVSTDALVIAVGLAISAALGIAAGLIPAFQASRREIAACFRAV
jgi:putative ABC transport system permease protein